MPVAGHEVGRVDGGVVVIAVHPARELVALGGLGHEGEGAELDVGAVLDGLEEGAVLVVEGDGVAGHGVRSVSEDRLDVYRGALDLDVAGDEVLVLVTDPLPAREDLALGDLDGPVGGGPELSEGRAGRKGGGGYNLVALVEVHGGELNTLDSLYRLLFGCKRLSNWSNSLTNSQRSTQTGCDCGVSPPHFVNFIFYLQLY